jgi:hypothetical protein
MVVYGVRDVRDVDIKYKMVVRSTRGCTRKEKGTFWTSNFEAMEEARKQR